MNTQAPCQPPGNQKEPAPRQESRHGGKTPHACDYACLPGRRRGGGEQGENPRAPLAGKDANITGRRYIKTSSHHLSEWRNGRRKRLKISRGRPRAGSSPASDTIRGRTRGARKRPAARTEGTEGLNTEGTETPCGRTESTESLGHARMAQTGIFWGGSRNLVPNGYKGIIAM